MSEDQKQQEQQQQQGQEESASGDQKDDGFAFLNEYGQKFFGMNYYDPNVGFVNTVKSKWEDAVEKIKELDNNKEEIWKECDKQMSEFVSEVNQAYTRKMTAGSVGDDYVLVANDDEQQKK